MIVRVRGSGICGSDLHWAQLGMAVKPGQILGHEFSGDVVEVGRDVGDRFRVGDRVCSIPFIGCGHCRACLAGDVTTCDTALATGLQAPGAYAEFVKVGAAEALHLPEAVNHRQGALGEPLAVGLHAVAQARPDPGARVLLIGAGLLAVGYRHLSPSLVDGRLGAHRAIGPGEEKVLDAEAATNLFDGSEAIPQDIPVIVPAEVAPDAGPNYLLWGGIGVGVLALLTITYLVARKK